MQDIRRDQKMEVGKEANNEQGVKLKALQQFQEA